MVDPNPVVVKKKGPSIGLVLGALLMLLLSVGVVAWKVPLAPCPSCRVSAPAAVPDKEAASCPTCKAAAVTVDRFRTDPCPTCKSSTPAPAGEPAKAAPCAACGGEGKIPFFKKWGGDRLKLEDVPIPNPLK